MTKSKVKTAVIALIAWAVMLALLLVPGIKSPASAETWKVAFTEGNSLGTFARPDTVTVGWEDNVSFHNEDPVSALKVTLGDVVIADNTYTIVQNSSNACINMTFEYYCGSQVHTTTLNYEDGGVVDGFYFQCLHPNENTTVFTFNLAPSASNSHFDLLLGIGNGLDCVFDDETDITKDWYLTISAVYYGQGESFEMTFSRIKFNVTNKTAKFELSDADRTYNEGYQAGYQAGLAAGGSGSGHTDEELAAARQEGYNSGYGSGKQDGFEDGLESGKKLGYTNGFTDGNKPGSEIFIENGVKTKFARPDNLSASCVLHTFGDGEKHAMRINFGNITLNDKVWSPYLTGTFSALSLKIVNPTSGSSSTIYWSDLSSGLGLGYDDNKNNIDLTCDSNGVWSFYFATPMRGETVNLVANGKTYSISNKTSNKDWTFTLTVAYAAADSNTGDTLPEVEYTSVNYNPDTYACAFVPTEAEEAYNDGHESGYSDGYSEGSLAGYDTGKTAGITEGRQTGYDEGYAAGLAAAKNTPGTEDKTDGKPGDNIITDKPVSWLKKNKTTLIVGSLLVVGLVVLLCILNRVPRRRR